MLSETKETPNTTLLNSNNNVSARGDVDVSKASTSTERSEMVEPIVPSVKFSLPIFKKKVKSPEEIKLGNEPTIQNQKAKVDNNREVKGIEDNNAGAVTKVEETKIQSHPPNVFFKSSNNQENANKAGEVNQSQPQRPSPSNPFFKSSIK